MRNTKEFLINEKENLKVKKKLKSRKIMEGGITLIALVVTIIVLLILTGVTLNIALSDNGLFKGAQEAADKYKEAQEDEEDILEELENQLDNLTSIRDAKASKYEFETTTTLPDLNGNKVVIPGKFHIAEDSGDTVQEGIVIEDSDGNQFVWIPVSNIDGDNNVSTKGEEQKEEDLIKLNNGEKVEITLGRYTFAEAGEENPGTPELVQNGNNQTKDIPIEKLYSESIVTDRKNSGVGAKNLQDFINSVKKNHGYYIARYEASYGSGRTVDDYKPLVQKSENNSTSEMEYNAKTLWNFITQPDASKVSQNMYRAEDNDEEADYVESDLVNSYAWDTAIVYIQEMGNENYANQGRGSYTDLRNTGVTDEMCHIFDMAGNVKEWSTESSTAIRDGNECTCVGRGGFYNNGDACTAFRDNSTGGYNFGNIGFRSLLYLK